MKGIDSREFLKNALEPRQECLTIDELGRLNDARLSPADAQAAAAHLASCAGCRAELDMLVEFQTGEIRADEEDVVRAGRQRLTERAREIVGRAVPPRPVSWWRQSSVVRPLLAMAALLLLSVAGYLWRPGPPGFPSNIDTGREVARSLSLTVLTPAGDLAEVPRRLAWEPVAGATRYHVRVIEVDRHEVWASDAATTDTELPAAVRALMVPGKTLGWQVSAYTASGERLAESAVTQFRMTPAGSNR
jgi:anti-sigma factor RsiW